MNEHPNPSEVVAELQRVKCIFQQRAIAAVMDFPPPDRHIEDIDDE